MIPLLAIACAAFVAAIVLLILAPDGYETDDSLHLGNDPHLPPEFHSNHDGAINP